MAKNKWMTQLLKIDGAVTERVNPHNTVIQGPSPSFNFTFGNGWGLPLGFGLCMWGPPKSGKTLISNAMIGQMHKDYPDGIAVKFDTERRDQAQLTESQAKIWGIDLDRYVVYEGASPELVFDTTEKEIQAMCQQGAPIKLIIIDSINSIRGRRGLNATSVSTQQIGDHALTIKDGLSRIMDTVIRKYKIALVCSTHIAAEMDPIEQMRGNKTKMAAANALQHNMEYFMYVEKNRTKDGKTDMLGNDFSDENLSDMADRAEQRAHKIRVIMKDSSLGPKGRVGEFTLHEDLGIINVHEEIFKLGVNWGIIVKPNAMSYEFGGKKWVGKASMIEALKDDTDMQKAILKEIKMKDQRKDLVIASEEKLSVTVNE